MHSMLLLLFLQLDAEEAAAAEADSAFEEPPAPVHSKAVNGSATKKMKAKSKQKGNGECNPLFYMHTNSVQALALQRCNCGLHSHTTGWAMLCNVCCTLLSCVHACCNAQLAEHCRRNCRAGNSLATAAASFGASLLQPSVQRH
jgi:hypothetical protein